MGGLAFALPQYSILFEVAKFECHSRTNIPQPDCCNPCRVSIVFYQHRNMNALSHGTDILRIRNENEETGRR